MMNDQKKLKLSKETLRCLDDDDLTGVVGGWNRGGYSNDCNNSNGCQGSGICVSAECNSFVCAESVICFL
jgi:hypothetical protein